MRLLDTIRYTTMLEWSCVANATYQVISYIRRQVMPEERRTGF